MKKSKKQIAIKFAILVFASLNLFLHSCKKGDTGPAGANGKNGVANIKTTIFTTSSSNWIADNTNNLYYFQFNLADINSSIMSSGAVMLYLGDGTGNIWVAMPFTAKGVEFTYGIYLSNIEIDVTQSNGVMPNNPGIQQFKVVIIPPAMVKPNVNTKNYEDVKAAYNLAN